MKIIKGILNVLLSFLITVLIMANFVVNIFSNTILKKEYMLSQLEKNDIYGKIEVDLKNGFENYQYQSGLPEEVFEDLYTIDMLTKDVNSMINNIYGGTEVTISSEKVRDKIVENINTYLEENNIVLNQIEQENIDKFQDLIVKVYEEKVNVVSDKINPIVNIKEKVEKIVKLAKVSLMIILVTILIFTILINRKTLEICIRTISVSLLASGILLNLVTCVIYKNIDINNILLLTQTISDLIKNILYDILSRFNYFGIGFVIIGVAGIIISNYHKIKNP